MGMALGERSIRLKCWVTTGISGVTGELKMRLTRPSVRQALAQLIISNPRRGFSLEKEELKFGRSSCH